MSEGTHEEVVRLVFRPDVSEIEPKVSKAVESVNERARRAGGAGSAAPPSAATAAEHREGTYRPRHPRGPGATPSGHRTIIDTWRSIEQVAGYGRLRRMGLPGIQGMQSILHTAGRLGGSGGAGQSAASSGLVGNIARQLVRVVQHARGGFAAGAAGAPPPVPVAAGGAAGAAGAAGRLGHGAARGLTSLGGGSMAAGVGVAGVIAAGVVLQARSLAKSLGELSRGVKQTAVSFLSGDASKAIKGAVSFVQGAARSFGTVIGGPILGAIVAKVVGVGNRLVDAMDNLVNSLGKYNPVVAGQIRQYEVQQKLFRMKVANAFQPAMSAWVKLKGTFLDILGRFAPILNKGAKLIGWFFTSIDRVLNAIIKAFLKFASALEWIIAMLRLKPITWEEAQRRIQEWWEEAGLDNEAKAKNRAFAHAGRNLGGGSRRGGSLPPRRFAGRGQGGAQPRGQGSGPSPFQGRPPHGLPPQRPAPAAPRAPRAPRAAAPPPAGLPPGGGAADPERFNPNPPSEAEKGRVARGLAAAMRGLKAKEQGFPFQGIPWTRRGERTPEQDRRRRDLSDQQWSQRDHERAKPSQRVPFSPPVFRGPFPERPKGIFLGPLRTPWRSSGADKSAPGGPLSATPPTSKPPEPKVAQAPRDDPSSKYKSLANVGPLVRIDQKHQHHYRIAHEKGIHDAVMQIRGQLLKGLLDAQDETRLTGALLRTDDPIV